MYVCILYICIYVCNYLYYIFIDILMPPRAAQTSAVRNSVARQARGPVPSDTVEKKKPRVRKRRRAEMGTDFG